MDKPYYSFFDSRDSFITGRNENISVVCTRQHIFKYTFDAEWFREVIIPEHIPYIEKDGVITCDTVVFGKRQRVNDKNIFAIVKKLNSDGIFFSKSDIDLCTQYNFKKTREFIELVTSLDVSTPYPLHTSWTLWHSPKSDSNVWSIEKISSFDTIQGFWELYNHFVYHFNDTTSTQLFLMRDTIVPQWEHELNRNGGCWSFIVPKKAVDPWTVWLDVSLMCIGETLMKNFKDSTLITGISMSLYKPNVSNLKIWNSDSTKTILKDYINPVPCIKMDGSRYTPHIKRR